MRINHWTRFTREEDESIEKPPSLFNMVVISAINMANRADFNKLCSNLTSMGVEIKPEEVQNPSRPIAFRVITDFATTVFLTAQDLLNQHLALALENCNPNSAASPSAPNK